MGYEVVGDMHLSEELQLALEKLNPEYKDKFFKYQVEIIFIDNPRIEGDKYIIGTYYYYLKKY